MGSLRDVLGLEYDETAVEVFLTSFSEANGWSQRRFDGCEAKGEEIKKIRRSGVADGE